MILLCILSLVLPHKKRVLIQQLKIKFQIVLISLLITTVGYTQHFNNSDLRNFNNHGIRRKVAQPPIELKGIGSGWVNVPDSNILLDLDNEKMDDVIFTMFKL